MKIPIDVLINLDTDYHLKLEDTVKVEPSLSSSIDKMVWNYINILVAV